MSRLEPRVAPACGTGSRARAVRQHGRLERRVKGARACLPSCLRSSVTMTMRHSSGAFARVDLLVPTQSECSERMNRLRLLRFASAFSLRPQPQRSAIAPVAAHSLTPHKQTTPTNRHAMSSAAAAFASPEEQAAFLRGISPAALSPLARQLLDDTRALFHAHFGAHAYVPIDKRMRLHVWSLLCACC